MKCKHCNYTTNSDKMMHLHMRECDGWAYLWGKAKEPVKQPVKHEESAPKPPSPRKPATKKRGGK